MNADTRAQILEARAQHNPKKRLPPATEEELQEFERSHGPVPEDYRWFLCECGGGQVGSRAVTGIRALAETQREFAEVSDEPLYWPWNEMLILGLDELGNWYGVHPPTGQLFLWDHTFGGNYVIAESFGQFLIKGLIGGPDAEAAAEHPMLPLDDCERVGWPHDWFQVDSEHSACHNCQVIRRSDRWSVKRDA